MAQSLFMLTDWEIWLDNIAPIVGKWLKDEFNLPVKSAFVLQMKTLSDLEIYNKAKQSGNVIIISKDSDMVELITLFGSSPKLINIKTEIAVTVICIMFLEPHRSSPANFN
jgi:predicted nuclease of predicted toxin-antitoxin system